MSFWPADSNLTALVSSGEPMQTTNNLNVNQITPLTPPDEIKEELPLSEQACQTVVQARQTVRNILDRKDRRLFAVVGPCSIHDTEAAMEYAQRLKALHEELKDRIYLIMRVYFEKPRTTVGWKGLINSASVSLSPASSRATSLRDRFSAKAVLAILAARS